MILRMRRGQWQRECDGEREWRECERGERGVCVCVRGEREGGGVEERKRVCASTSLHHASMTLPVRTLICR